MGVGTTSLERQAGPSDPTRPGASDAPVTVYLVRHGQTEWSRQGRAMGQTDIPLDPEGLRQAERVRVRLRDTPLRAAYSSDSSRAFQTAAIALEGKRVPLEFEADLREASWGRWEGLTYDEAAAHDPASYERFMAGDLDTPPPGGESVRRLMARLGGFARLLRARHAGESVLVVGHEGSLRALALQLLDVRPAAFWQLRIALASLSTISVYSETGVLELWNDTSHHRGA